MNLAQYLKDIEVIPERLQEAWNVAQTLTAQHSPELAQDLNNVRTRIIKAIDFEIRQPYNTPQFTPAFKIDVRWWDIEITPEVSSDPRLSFVNVKINKAAIFRLRRLLKAQRLLIEELQRRS